ncbi:hypothetical protein F11_01050 [Rhodospirillum rubrum F11]|nr:hypothetical protein F11_01050 [Rhodospirillum rubrum F11]
MTRDQSARSIARKAQNANGPPIKTGGPWKAEYRAEA